MTKLGGSVKNGLAAAAKIGVAAITSAADGIAALTKASIDNYAEYEQLVGGVETLFKDSADKVQQYAANAFQTAGISSNQYMETVTGFAASLISSFKDTSSAVTEESANAMINALDDQYDALEAANDKKINLLEQAQEKELNDFEKLTDEKIKLINKQYQENLKLIDEEKYNQLQAIQEQIDAINAEQDADDKARKKKSQNEKKARLQSAVNNASDAESRKKAQKELNDYLEELEAERVAEERKTKIKALKEQQQDIKDAADAKKKVLKEQYDEELATTKESNSQQLAEMKKAHKNELEALKESNAEKLKALKDYNTEQKALIKSSIGEITSTVELTAEDYAMAAEFANMAVIDMADNASKLGTSMESIQNAYQGFSKGQFELLDNLKLGYGGTKEEMERLLEDATKLTGVKYDINNFADIVEAIHAIQVEMGISGITAEEAAEAVASGTMTEEEAFNAMGTTAKEAATTISGSLASAGAAWSNLVTGVADDNADFGKLIDNFVYTVSIAAKNLVPRVQIAIKGIGRLISKILPIIVKEIPNIINNVVPDVLKAATSLVSSIGQGLLDNAGLLTSSALELMLKLVGYISQALPNITNATIEIIKTIGHGLVEYAPQLITSVTDVIIKLAEIFTNPDNILTMVDIALQLILAIGNGLIEAIPKLVEAVPTVINGIVTAIVESMPMIIDAGTKLLSALLDNTDAILSAVLEGVVALVDGIMLALLDDTDGQSGISRIAEAGFNMFTAIVKRLPEVIETTAQDLTNFVTNISDRIRHADWKQIGEDIAKGIDNGMQTGVMNLFDVSLRIAEKIKNFNWGKVGASILQSVIDGMLEVFSGVLDAGINGVQFLSGLTGKDYGESKSDTKTDETKGGEGSGGNRGGTVINQYNYSPSALNASQSYNNMMKLIAMITR